MEAPVTKMVYCLKLFLEFLLYFHLEIESWKKVCKINVIQSIE